MEKEYTTRIYDKTGLLAALGSTIDMVRNKHNDQNVLYKIVDSVKKEDIEYLQTLSDKYTHMIVLLLIEYIRSSPLSFEYIMKKCDNRDLKMQVDRDLKMQVNHDLHFKYFLYIKKTKNLAYEKIFVKYISKEFMMKYPITIIYLYRTHWDLVNHLYDDDIVFKPTLFKLTLFHYICFSGVNKFYGSEGSEGSEESNNSDKFGNLNHADQHVKLSLVARRSTISRIRKIYPDYEQRCHALYDNTNISEFIHDCETVTNTFANQKILYFLRKLESDEFYL